MLHRGDRVRGLRKQGTPALPSPVCNGIPRHQLVENTGGWGHILKAEA